jgi:hypothetical protein
MEDNIGKLKGSLFKGKVVILYLINPHEAFSGGVAICDPKIEERQGRIFLVGEVPHSEGDWSSGLRIGVAFDQICHFIEFADTNEFLERTSSGIARKTLH